MAASNTPQDRDIASHVRFMDVVQKDHDRRIDRLEAKHDNILLIISGVTIVFALGMAAGFLAVLVALD